MPCGVSVVVRSRTPVVDGGSRAGTRSRGADRADTDTGNPTPRTRSPQSELRVCREGKPILGSITDSTSRRSGVQNSQSPTSMKISHILTIASLLIGMASVSLAGPGTGYTRGMGANQPAQKPDKSTCACCVTASTTTAPAAPDQGAAPSGQPETKQVPVQGKGTHSSHVTPRA